MGWEFGLDLIRELTCRVAIKYHNITPPKFFAGISQEYERVCQHGRDQIKDIVRADRDLYLADSEYNLWELLLEGVEKSKAFVVPPFHHVDRLLRSAPDDEIINTYASEKIKVLMVGRVAPNKGHSTLIDALAIYRNEYDSDAQLLIVGKEPEHLEPYSEALYKKIESLNLGDSVVFTGSVSDEQLKTYYLVADFFMMASEHEGFCVPLIEAMAMKVPIIACASSAIPGTVGKAGLVWKERNPYLLAESINYLANDESTSAALGLVGWRRFQQFFSNEKIAAEFFVALEHLW
jgi:glycosyltransferase involved in cell wall biosynthesis